MSVVGPVPDDVDPAAMTLDQIVTTLRAHGYRAGVGKDYLPRRMTSPPVVLQGRRVRLTGFGTPVGFVDYVAALRGVEVSSSARWPALPGSVSTAAITNL